MATREQHIRKYRLFWELAQKKYREAATPFLCMNLIMYSVGHLIEALLAEEGRHPSSPPRGVPHADREALLRKVLVAKGRLEETWVECYSELVAQRDTFIDGGVQDRAFVERYMTLARPFIQRLQTLVEQR
jgi:uncharacterized protein (UPF0332 family)